MPNCPYSISGTISVGENNASAAIWNSGTALNTVALLVNNDYSYNAILVTLNQTTTITGGVVTFQGSTDGVNFFPITGFTPGTYAEIGPTYTLTASTYQTFSFNLTAIPYFQVVLTTALTGTGQVTIGYTADSYVNTVGAVVTNTVTVSGTVAATQSGTWTVQQGGAPWSVTISGQPIAVSQSGTWTVGITGQTNWGTAPATSVSVQGVNAELFVGQNAVSATAPVPISATAAANASGNPIFVETVSGSTTVVTGTVAVTQSTSPWVVSLASTTITGTVAVTQSTSPWVVAGNLTNNSAAPSTNNVGVLSAIAETAYTTVTYTTGDMVLPVTDLHGALNHDLQAVGGTAVVTAAAGVQKVGIVGNAGASVDSTAAAGTAPTNAVLTSGIYNAGGVVPTTGQAVSMQLDQDGNHLTFPGVQQQTGAAWSSATTLNTLQYPTGTATQGQLVGIPAIVVQLDQTTTLTGGKVTFQGTYDNINWVTIPVQQVVNPNTFAQLTNPYTFVASTQQAFLILLQGYVSVRLNLTTVITGTGTVTPYWATLSENPVTTTVVTGTGGSGSINVSVVPSSNTFFRFGQVATAAQTNVKVEFTTYTEQSTAVQRSISSSSANDTAAGTGARTVLITYYDASGNGPFTETDTLNGTTAVATTATNICFIESLKVMTVGSTGSNVGTISLFVNATGGGGTIGTIAATNNTTFWAHHYVPNGKTFHLTGINIGSTSTTVGDGGQYALYQTPVPVANQPLEQISDTLVLYGQSSTATRNYNSPVQVVGPARVQLQVLPYTSSGQTYFGSFDFFEQ